MVIEGRRGARGSAILAAPLRIAWDGDGVQRVSPENSVVYEGVLAERGGGSRRQQLSRAAHGTAYTGYTVPASGTRAGGRDTRDRARVSRARTYRRIQGRNEWGNEWVQPPGDFCTATGRCGTTTSTPSTTARPMRAVDPRVGGEHDRSKSRHQGPSGVPGLATHRTGRKTPGIGPPASRYRASEPRKPRHGRVWEHPRRHDAPAQPRPPTLP